MSVGKQTSVAALTYGGSDVSARAGKALPTLGSVVSWASAVIDAHFTTFAMEQGGGAAGAAMGVLRQSAVALQASCAAVGRVAGALQHVAGPAAGGPHLYTLVCASLKRGAGHSATVVLNTAAVLSHMAHTNPPSGRARLYVMHGSVIPVVEAFGSTPRSSQTLDDIPFNVGFGSC